ncbi:hypothetical protein [Halobacterium hubeiense]|uniref:hypothetical protein n=1 Tax=Halobacterium hubeiense TaxID=1407499 RepID=UPI003C747CB3
MNWSRAVSIALALAAVSLLATGTLGFTSVSAERGVSVNVVDTDKAYVGVTACEPTNGNGSDANASSNNGQGNADVYVTVTNRYSEPLTVEGISANTHDAAPTDRNSIGSGARETYALHVDATEVTVDVDGDGFDATVTAEVESADRSDCNPGKRTSNSGNND